MAVEIYLEPELEEMQSPEVSEEWKSLASELGMEGQLKLIEPNKDGENKKASPYMYMNLKMERMFAILCPEVVDYKKYDKSTIPREVLKEILFAENQKHFDYIKIWYDDASPDPVVVGYIKTGSYDYVKHLIARFGDEILPFEVLEEKAMTRLTKSYKTQLENAVKSADTKVYEFMNPTRYTSNDLTISIEGVKYAHRNPS